MRRLNILQLPVEFARPAALCEEEWGSYHTGKSLSRMVSFNAYDMMDEGKYDEKSMIKGKGGNEEMM